MESELAQEAIAAALSCDWKNAILLNLKLLKINPENVDALNRIARAYAENGDIKKAQINTAKVLKFDPNNTIAKKCQQKWKNFKRDGNLVPSTVSANSFIEEPTRTKIVNLINLGEIVHLSSLDCGDQLKMTTNTHRVNLTTHDDKYVGRFPDDLALKYISMMKLGATYEVFVKTASKDEVRIVLRTIS